MDNKIQRLCKRLNKFTLEEISLIAELDKSETKKILNDLIKTNFLKKKDDIYIYIGGIKKTKQENQLPLMFQFHSPETIELIIKCFCAEIEVDKIVKILSPQKHCINKFFAYFRDKIYEQQFTALNKHIEENPYIPRERDYMGKKVHLYLYEYKLFVSTKCLNGPVSKNYNNDERLEIKNVYLRSYRKVQNIAYKKYFHLHLTEQIWRYGKEFKQLNEELFDLLFL